MHTCDPNFGHGGICVIYGICGTHGCRPAAVNTVKPLLRGSRRGHRARIACSPPGQLEVKAWTCPKMVCRWRSAFVQRCIRRYPMIGLRPRITPPRSIPPFPRCLFFHPREKVGRKKTCPTLSSHSFEPRFESRRRLDAAKRRLALGVGTMNPITTGPH